MKYCAIFDLDETLIKTKSMIEIMKEYYWQNSIFKKMGEFKFSKFQKSLESFAKNNSDRTIVNRFYYQNLKGISVNKMLQTSQRWFAKTKDTLFNNNITAEMSKHKKNGAEIIVVTGSFYECISPILEYLNIPHVVCAETHKDNGRYTGILLSPPTIGLGKAYALQKYITENNLSLEQSYAYGDHESDIPMLMLAKHPVAVGNNKILKTYATKNNWLAIAN